MPDLHLDPNRADTLAGTPHGRPGYLRDGHGAIFTLVDAPGEDGHEVGFCPCVPDYYGGVDAYRWSPGDPYLGGPDE